MTASRRCVACGSQPRRREFTADCDHGGRLRDLDGHESSLSVAYLLHASAGVGHD